LPFTTDASKHHYQQEIIYLMHWLLSMNTICMLNKSMQIY
jgi:hypothetical protein